MTFFQFLKGENHYVHSKLEFFNHLSSLNIRFGLFNLFIVGLLVFHGLHLKDHISKLGLCLYGFFVFNWVQVSFSVLRLQQRLIHINYPIKNNLYSHFLNFIHQSNRIWIILFADGRVNFLGPWVFGWWFYGRRTTQLASLGSCTWPGSFMSSLAICCLFEFQKIWRTIHLKNILLVSLAALW